MITQVGWCEVQMFGHTFPDMHLEERLGQLNSMLNFSPGTPDIKLMDDMGALIKSVQAHKPQTRSLGATAAGQAQ